MNVQDLVTSDYESVTPDTRVSKLLGIFEDADVKGILVVDDGDVSGIVSRRHLATSQQDPDEKVGRLAIPVPHIEPREDVREAARLMVEGDTWLLPVFEGADLAGVVTSTAIVDAVRPFLDAVDVRAVATTDVVTVHPEGTFGSALHDFRAHNVSHLPVVENGSPVGVLSLYDVVDLSAREVDRSSGGDAGGLGRGGFGAREGERERLLDLPVRDLMASPVRTVRPDATLRDAVEEMDAVGASSVIAVEDGAVVGIVTTTDVLSALTRETEGQRAVQVTGMDLLDDATYSDVVEMVDDLSRVGGDLVVFDAKVHLHEHKENVRGTPLLLASVRLFTDEGTFIASGEGYGASAALNEASDTLERRVRDHVTYGRSKKHPDEAYWEKRFGWWLEE